MEPEFFSYGTLRLTGEVSRRSVHNLLHTVPDSDLIGTLKLTRVQSKLCLDVSSNEFYFPASGDADLIKGTYESTRYESATFAVHSLSHTISAKRQQTSIVAHGELRHIRPSSYDYTQAVSPGIPIIGEKSVDYRWGTTLTIPDINASPITANVLVELGEEDI